MGRREHREVLIRAGGTAVRARLLRNPVADHVWSLLPVYALAEIAGGIVHFGYGQRLSLPVQLPDVGMGALAYAAEHHWMAIGVGPPASQGSPSGTSWPLWARMLDDPALLKSVTPGARVAVLLAES